MQPFHGDKKESRDTNTVSRFRSVSSALLKTQREKGYSDYREKFHSLIANDNCYYLVLYLS